MGWPPKKAWSSCSESQSSHSAWCCLRESTKLEYLIEWPESLKRAFSWIDERLENRDVGEQLHHGALMTLAFPCAAQFISVWPTLWQGTLQVLPEQMLIRSLMRNSHSVVSCVPAYFQLSTGFYHPFPGGCSCKAIQWLQVAPPKPVFSWTSVWPSRTGNTAAGFAVSVSNKLHVNPFGLSPFYVAIWRTNSFTVVIVGLLEHGATA